MPFYSLILIKFWAQRSFWTDLRAKGLFKRVICTGGPSPYSAVTMWLLTFFFWQLGPYLHEMGAIGYFRLICRQFWTGIDICRSLDLWPEGIWRHFRILSPTHPHTRTNKRRTHYLSKNPKTKGRNLFFTWRWLNPYVFVGKLLKCRLLGLTSIPEDVSSDVANIRWGFLGFLRFLGFRYLG